MWRLEARDGRIVDIKGMAVKQHGLEKLDYGKILKWAIIRMSAHQKNRRLSKKEMHPG